jgi:hypothetical protein
MWWDEMKGAKGRRRGPEDKTADELLAELRRRPETPIPVISEDVAVLEGLIDLLVLKGVITDIELDPGLNRYKSVITALIDLLVQRGVISDTDLEKAIVAYHFTLRNCRPDATASEIFESRRSHLHLLLER